MSILTDYFNLRLIDNHLQLREERIQGCINIIENTFKEARKVKTVAEFDVDQISLLPEALKRINNRLTETRVVAHAHQPYAGKALVTLEIEYATS